jgi:hypothetical protein
MLTSCDESTIMEVGGALHRGWGKLQILLAWWSGVADERVCGGLHRFVDFARAEVWRSMMAPRLAPVASWSRSRVERGRKNGVCTRYRERRTGSGKWRAGLDACCSVWRRGAWAWCYIEQGASGESGAHREMLQGVDFGSGETKRHVGRCGTIPLGRCFGLSQNEQCWLSIKQNCQMVMNLNQPNIGLPKL